MIHVLVDLRPRLLADAIALALNGPDRVIDIATDEVGVHDGRVYDLVVVEEAARAARPGRYTVRVHPTEASHLEQIQALMDWIQTQGGSAVVQPER